MKREILRFIKTVLLIGVFSSLVLLLTGFTSPVNIFSDSISSNNTHYDYVEHSGPYMVNIRIEKSWSVKIWFSPYIKGNYKLLWKGNGNYPTIIHVFIPSRGYVKIWSNQSGEIFFQRLRPAFQYDYLYQGLYSLIGFSGFYIVIILYNKHLNK